jgi:hypothetical protein
MRKVIAAFAAVLSAAAIAFAWAWLDRYRESAWMFEEAMASYRAGDYLAAINGDQTSKGRGGRYYFGVGFLDVARVWSDAPAWLRPSCYGGSLTLAREAVASKMDVDSLRKMVDEYTAEDIDYIPVAKTRLGDALFAEGDFAGASSLFTEAKETVGADPAVVRNAASRIAECRKRMEGR